MKKIKYFVDFIEKQENWLNKMAKEGHRLVKVGKLTYEFEKCKQNEYIYCVEFVADKSNLKIKEYKDFLEDDVEYKCFNKNININYSIGKMKLRPWVKGIGKVSTSPGSFNKELLIVEKRNDGKDFNLHTDKEDLVNYLTPIRNMYIFTTLLIAMIILYKYLIDTLDFKYLVVWSLIFIFLVIQSVKYFSIVKKYKKDIKLHE